MQLYKTLHVTFLFAAMALTAGCGSKPSQAPAAFPAPEVGVVTVSAESLPITSELPGRIDAVRTAQVRARATGIILKQMFTEGADVKEGDVLFQIDPAPLKAVYDSAAAGLAKAQAMLKQVEARAERYKALVAINAVSKQEYDDIVSASAQAQAELQAAKAAVETAKLNLGYTTVTSPISGRIGAGKVTEGAFVNQVEATQLAVVQQLDPVYFDFTQSSTDVLKLKRAMDEGKLQSIAPGEAKITLLLEDGSVYPEIGKLLFSDITVDQTSGMVTLRAEFPNADHTLLPGMFARGRIEQAVDSKAIAVSQRGVALGAGGNATVMTVSADNKVEIKTVKIGSAVGDKWIISEGLAEGDRVIVEGLQKVKPGMEVKAVPFVRAADASVVPAAPKGN